jgi:hypothetical protein
VRDLEFLIPPKFIICPRASFSTYPKKHLYAILMNFLVRIVFGDRDEMEFNLDSQTWWCLKLSWW